LADQRASSASLRRLDQLTRRSSFYKNFGSTTSATTTLCDAWPSGSWGILHGCLRHHTTYQQATAWPATYEQQQAA
jgi:hypothetical protein